MSEDRRLDELLVAYLESGTADEAALAALDPDARAAFAEAVGDLDALRSELDEAATWEQPDASLEGRIVDAILAAPALAAAPAERAGGVDAAADIAPPAAASGDQRSSAAPMASLAEERARRSRAIAIVASLVAAAAVAVAVVGFATRPATTSGESAGPPTSTSATSPRGPDRVVIGAPVDVPLEPTELLPGASGRVRLDETESGVWIRLDATGLPRRDDGQFYEAWVRTPQGLVPIGTFHTGDDVVLWSGVGIDETTAVTVTLEENDGNQESSGQRVLVATIPRPGGTVPR